MARIGRHGAFARALLLSLGPLLSMARLAAIAQDPPDLVLLDVMIPGRDGYAVVVDVSRQADADRDYLITPADLMAWEQAHGPVGEETLVLFRTGWGSRWPDRARYLGTTKTGQAAVHELHFPGIHPDAARWLVQRRVRAVGIDTPSIDRGQSTTFDTHQILFAADIPAFENVAHLSALPPVGSFVIALPMKIKGGTGGPLRIVAVLPVGTVRE